MAKLRGGELNQAVYEMCVELLGADGMLWDTYEMRQPSSWYEFGVMPSDVRRASTQSREHDRGWHERDPAQHRRGAHSRSAAQPKP